MGAPKLDRNEGEQVAAPGRVILRHREHGTRAMHVETRGDLTKLDALMLDGWSVLRIERVQTPPRRTEAPPARARLRASLDDHVVAPRR